MGYGDLIRKHRESKQWRQSDLAARLGCSDSYITVIESEKRQPSEDFLQALATELGLSGSDRSTLRTAVEQTRVEMADQRRTTRSHIVRPVETFPGSFISTSEAPERNEFTDIEWLSLIANVREAYENPILRDSVVRAAQSWGDLARSHKNMKRGKLR